MKLIAAIVMAAFALVCTSCKSDDETGRVRYSIGASSLHISSAKDLATFGILEAAYAAECNAISGITSVDATNFEMQGNYKSCDEKVKTACLAVENRFESEVSMDGYVTLEVTATYYVGAETRVIYSKTWGTK